MALTEKHRSIIYAHFVETIGEEAAEAMLSQFPARDLDEPVTKEFVQAEIADVRREIAVLRGEMQTEFAKVRGELAAVGSRLSKQSDRLMARMQIVIGIASAVIATVVMVTR